MGMLVEGEWRKDDNRYLVEGAYCREQIALHIPSPDALAVSISKQENIILVASLSCPWSHRSTLARAVLCLDHIRLAIAGGPRTEGYQLTGGYAVGIHGEKVRYLHQLYRATDPTYTGRVTVPVLWDSAKQNVLCNDSATIARAFALVAGSADITLVPCGLTATIDALNERIYDGLSNAVYRAGFAETQEAYDSAVGDAFDTLDWLESILDGAPYLAGDHLTESDIFLFSTLVRFDVAYTTLFRCTRRRLVDYPNLWRYTRSIYALPAVAETVDFRAIRDGYFLNDTSNNPHAILPDLPEIDWSTDGSGAS